MSDRPVCPSCGHSNEPGARFCAQCASSLSGASPERESAAQAFAQKAVGATPAKKAAGGNKKFALVGVVVVMAVVPIAVMGFSGVFGSGSTEGEIRSTGEPNGDWTLRPTACYSGAHESFFGVWAAPELSEDSNGRTGFKGGLKVVKSNIGQWEAYLESPVGCESFSCPIHQVDPQYCSVFDIDVSNTNTTINDIRVREGHAKLECEFPEGGTLSVHLTFDGCH